MRAGMSDAERAGRWFLHVQGLVRWRLDEVMCACGRMSRAVNGQALPAFFNSQQVYGMTEGSVYATLYQVSLMLREDPAQIEVSEQAAGLWMH